MMSLGEAARDSDSYRLRQEVIANNDFLPPTLPQKVRVRITFSESRSCIREYREYRRQLLIACLEHGHCQRSRWYKPHKCFLFKAEADVGDRRIAVGYLMLVIDKVRRGLIYDLYVARAWRRKGIGTALVKAAIALLRTLNSPKIKAVIPDKDIAEVMINQGIDVTPEACRRLLEKMGFRQSPMGDYVLNLK